MKLSKKSSETLEKLGAERKLVKHKIKAHAKAMEFDEAFGGLEFTGTNEAGIDGLPLGIPSMELGLHVVKSKWFHKAPDPKGCVGIGRYDAGTELSLYMDEKGKVFVWGWELDEWGPLAKSGLAMLEEALVPKGAKLWRSPKEKTAPSKALAEPAKIDGFSTFEVQRPKGTTFWGCGVSSPTRGMALLTDGLYGCHCQLIGGKWKSNAFGNIDFRCVSASAQYPLAISSDGDLQLGDSIDQIGHASPHRKKGGLRCIRHFPGTSWGILFAAGMSRMVWTRAEWKWVSIGPAGKTDAKHGFLCIDGTSDKDVYFAGTYGEIWRWDGAAWTQIPSGTTRAIWGIHCFGNEIFACGPAGLFLRGDRNGLAPIDSGTGENLLSLCSFDGKIYAASPVNLFVLEKDSLKVKKAPGATGWISANGGAMWSAGGSDLFATTDGVKWERLTPPDESAHFRKKK
jgi:hypothetical protein